MIPPWVRYGALTAALSLLALGCSAPDADPGAQATNEELLEWSQRRVDAGDLTGAISGLRRVLQRDSLHVGALVNLAHVYTLQERHGPADRYRRRAFHVAYTAGLRWQQADQPDSARIAFQLAVQVMPHHPLAHLRLGELQLQAGHADSAIHHFETAVEANPSYTESLILLGQSYLEANRLAEAEGLFERAIAANINALDAYLGLGALHLQQENWSAAVPPFEKALLIDPRSPAAVQGLDTARRGVRGQL